MENLGYIIGMYFQSVSSYHILCGELSYKKFHQDDFDALALSALPHLSDTETRQLYIYLKNRVTGCETGLNVFEALKNTANQYLLIRENKPICRYDRILQWRRLTERIGEDLPICAFLAHMTQENGYTWKDFEWNTVIGNDNMQFNRIMQKGISDNHFHLFGSAPSFHLIWIKLMNQVDNERFVQALQWIDKKKRNTREHYSFKYKEESLEKMHFQAALIRAVLYCYIHRIPCIEKIVSEADCGEQGYVWIKNILLREEGRELYCNKVQNLIYSLGMLKQFTQDDESRDYANMGYENESINHEFEGERAFMYQMLLGEANGKRIPDFMMDWFYAYLVIKTKFREELVQVNQTIGFENFSQYSRRKGKFLYTPEDDKLMIQHAVRGSFETGNLKSLELRISPEKNAERNCRWIQKCDNAIKEAFYTDIGQQDDEVLRNVYYVLHFPKKPDECLEVESGIVETCRHEIFRQKIGRQAEELIRFREVYPKQASRVLGIDACSQEIGCRPEVFASVFRRLSGHVAAKPVSQWKITYHAGEDWLDVMDGLRAVDEAMYFLDMKNGDRLGHATILGLNIRKWYDRKKNILYLPLQDYLDNIVWFYHKLIDFDILGCETLKGILQREYEQCFRKLYENCVIEDYFYYGIDTYYEAWKLRGDNPLLYKTGNFKELQFGENLYDKMQGSGVIRNKETIQLNYYYHYSADVRTKGQIPIKREISDLYVDGAEKIQKQMQKLVAEKGIFVETNPSSNYRISTMESYEEHPILNMYNLGLTLDAKETKACAQIHVSINTDDKGVFDTSLENEFALMGCALEQMKDENGKNKYSKQMVYDWIERIRQNGNQQSFWERISYSLQE